MRSLVTLSLFAVLNTYLTAASPLHRRIHDLPAFFLAGDSTTAAQSCCGGGWGNGFLSTLQNGALGSNFGHNGATTVSFVYDGDWGDVLESVSRYSKSYTTYVTIAVSPHPHSQSQAHKAADQSRSSATTTKESSPSTNTSPTTKTSPGTSKPPAATPSSSLRSLSGTTTPPAS